MSNTSGLKVLTALPTVFRPDGSVDLAQSRNIAERIGKSTLDGCFVGGTTSEFLAQTEAERFSILASMKDAIGAKRLVGHISTGSVPRTLDFIAMARDIGLSEVAIITPYFLPTDDETTLQYFEHLSRQLTGLRAYVYLFEERTTTYVDPATLARIAQFDGFVGAKISGYDIDTVARYRDAAPADFEVWTGNDADFGDLQRHGIEGCVSGVSAVFIGSFERMISAVESGEGAKIESARREIGAVVAAIDGSIANIKCGLSVLGFPAGDPMMPMRTVTESAKRHIAEAIAQYC